MEEEKRVRFVIMQIGNPEMDKLYSEVYCPALKSVGLQPRRIDKDNEGKILKQEIIEKLC